MEEIEPAEKPRRSVVPSSRFHFLDYPPSARLAEFRRLTSSIYDIWAIGDVANFRAEAIGYRVGGLIFNRVAFSPARFVRNEGHMEQGGRDFLVLQHQYSGNELLLMGHGNVRIDAGNLCLRDWSFPFESQATEMRIDSVVIPRHRLRSSVLFDYDHPVLSLPLTSLGARMLAGLWSDFFSQLQHVSLGDAEVLVEGFLGFLDGVLGYGARDEPSKTLRAMEQFLLVRLRHNVDAEELCRHFHLSRSQVFRLFQPHGGVQAFTKRLRLERCFAELLTADPAHTRVQDIAVSWGFLDPSLFSRQFRALFGQSPSSLLGQGLGGGPPQAEQSKEAPLTTESYCDYRDWLAQVSRPSAKIPAS